MRIAYMLTSLGIGGAERQVIALAERMAARGHEVMLLVLRPTEAHEWSTSIEVIHLDMQKSFACMCSGLGRGRRRLRSFHPDIVHSHTFPANMAARILHMLGSAPDVLSTIHNIYEGGWQRTLAYKISDRFSIYTTAVSEAVANHYCQIGAVPRRKCSVVTNGIDLAEFSLGAQSVSRARESMRAADDFIWLAAGRIVPAKDFENLLEAFRRVRAEVPQTQLWIAGQLSEVRRVRINGELVGTERHEAENIHWLGLRNDMPAILGACDAFVLSSAWEGMPLVVGEAMAMQRPVVATDAGGVRELVGDAGVIIPPKCPEALAGAMLRVMRTPKEERDTMGTVARERILQNFDMTTKALEWEALYSRLLRNRR
jgi:glycosyltransferase involved in cell wall biosynthesis